MMRPIVEYGMGETVHSAVFSRASLRTIVATLNNKQIKIFDMKGTCIID